MDTGNKLDQKFFVATTSYEENLDSLGNKLTQAYVQVEINKQGKWTVSLYELTKVIEDKIGMNRFARLGEDDVDRKIYFFNDRMPKNQWFIRSCLVGTETLYLHNMYMTLEKAFEMCEDGFSKAVIKTLSEHLTKLSDIKPNKSSTN